MREIVLDTETTGFEPSEGHRLVEIGCVELINHLPSGNEYQVYINPERDMPADAERVHGLSADFLADKPVFEAVVDDFLAFIGDAPLVIHNAAFDMKFLNAELSWADRPTLAMERAIDTLHIARRKFPGAPVNLDALCRRFNVDLSDRTKHGAVIDCTLLAAVYLELIGGRQPGLVLAEDAGGSGAGTQSNAAPTEDFPSQEALEALAQSRPVRPVRAQSLSEEEQAAHQAFLETKITAPLWKTR